MTEYIIAGEKVVIPTSVENECYLRRKTSKVMSEVGEKFDKWYKAQWNCDMVYDREEEIVRETIYPIIEQGIKIFNEQDIYSLDVEMFEKKYFSDGLKNFHDGILKMMYKIWDIDDQKETEKDYRRARKAGRGKVVGGGFGVGGALKGMAVAGAMNATTGMAYSLGNAVGNIGSSIAAGSNKSAVYKSSREPLKKEIVDAAYAARNAIREALRREAHIECEYVSATESKQADVIIENYKQGRISESQKKPQLIKALLLNPYNMNAYLLLWSDYGDESGDLREMADFFDCPLKKVVQKVAEEFSKTLYQKNCAEYENSFNKPAAAIRNEDKIKSTLTKLEEYCVSHNIDEDLLPEIKECRNILVQIDKDIRTVRGVTYETRECANSVEEDYEGFYNLLHGKNDFDDELKNFILDKNYKTDEFRKILPELIEKEERYRNAENVFESINEIVTKNVKKDIIGQGWIDCSNVIGNMPEKENMMKTLVQFMPNEAPLILFDRKDKGKSGILLTNMALREYSKGIFSDESKYILLDKIGKIECIASDEYLIRLVDNNATKISLKHGNLPAEDQIALAEAISKIVFLIKNFTPENRKLIYRIVYCIATCSCGTHLVPGEVICPGCGKMLRENGEFVETEICPACKSVIPKGKSFCSKCGKALNANAEQEIADAAPTYIMCRQCNTKIPIGKKFCSACGCAVGGERSDEAVKDMPKICPNCKNTIKAGKKFCSVCGTKIE